MSSSGEAQFAPLKPDAGGDSFGDLKMQQGQTDVAQHIAQRRVERESLEKVYGGVT